MTNKNHKSLLIAGVLIVALALISWLIELERQNIYDWFALYNYHAPAAISQLATQDGMTSYTRKVFYVNHPLLEPKDSFSSYCPNNSEQTVVLGCYHTDQKGIFLLSVSDSNLYGIEQVTAAYETLHAIYQRLTGSEQAKLNSELISFENNGLNSPVVKAQIAGFRKSEPGAVLNEMTSLFGTEVQNLPPALNAFYAKYFLSRQTLLNYYNDYQSAFTSREQQILDYNSQLTSLNGQINSDENSLSSLLSALSEEQASLNAEQSSGLVTEYNDQVGGYNQQVNSYNSLARTVKSLADQYNQIVAERNSIVLETQQLTQDITSPAQQAVK